MVSAVPIRVITSSSAGSVHATMADAAANLAGDVNAAAEAYENLKRLLERQFADPPRASLDSSPNLEAALALRQPPAATPLPGGFAHAAGQGPRHLDIRGFLAGVAVSAAIGAALYICLAAG